MMVTSEETIKNLQNEVLRLKLIVFQQDQMLEQRGRPPGQDLDETKRDLIADLMTTNDELRKQIQELNAQNLEEEEPEREPSEPERPQMNDAECQTNLDRLNIEQLIEASLALKKLKRQQLQQQEQLIQERQEALHKQQQQPIYHNHYLERPPPMQSSNQLSADEKESLDKLFKLDGLLTTARDRLRAVALN